MSNASEIELLRSLFVNNPVPTLVSDENGIVFEANLAAQALFGYGEAEFRGLRLEDLIPDCGQEALARARDGAGREPGPARPNPSQACRGLHRSGAEFAAKFCLAPLGDGRWMATLQEASERAERDPAVESPWVGEARLKAMLQSMSDSVCIMDTNGRFVEFNEACAAFYRFRNKDEFLQTFVEFAAQIDMYFPDGRLATLDERPARRALRGEVGVAVEYGARRKDTGEAWTGSFSFAPIRDPSGAIVGTVVSGRDITQAKRMRQALAESEAQLALFIEHAPAALAMFDRDMRYLHASRRWLSDYAIGDRPLTGRSIYEVFPDISEDWKACHQRGLAGEVIRREDDRLERSDGSVQWIRWELRPWRAADGTIGGVVIFAEDISERKRVESELGMLRAEREHMTEFQVARQTMSALAHELSQPLNAMTLFATTALHLAQEANASPSRLSRTIENASLQAQRAGNVVRELLSFLHQGEVKTELMDIGESARELVTRSIAGRFRDVRFRFMLEPEVAVVHANRLQIEKVLANLIENGIEAMRRSGVAAPSIVVSVRRWNDRRSARVSVTDRGPGIDQAIRERIFEPFFTDKPNSLGMGLAISRSIVASHGGELWVESNPGEKTSFHFTLPLAAS